jgi:hypothetical protein
VVACAWGLVILTTTATIALYRAKLSSNGNNQTPPAALLPATRPQSAAVIAFSAPPPALATSDPSAVAVRLKSADPSVRKEAADYLKSLIDADPRTLALNIRIWIAPLMEALISIRT